MPISAGLTLSAVPARRNRKISFNYGVMPHQGCTTATVWELSEPARLRYNGFGQFANPRPHAQ
jgi:hypothetical protein